MNQHDLPGDGDLERRLGDLAARFEVPDVPVVEDLARGRRRLRRTRVAVIGSAVAAVVAVVAVAGAVPRLLDAGGAPSRPGFSDSSSSSREHRGATATATDLLERDGATRVTPGPPALPGMAGMPGATAADDGLGGETGTLLTRWEEVLAEHLDPSWTHLVRYDAKTNGNVQSGSGRHGLTSLGSKYGWRNPGESGLGMLQLSVSSGWRGLYWECGTPGAGWSCHDSTGPHGEPAQVAEHDGVLDVAVEHGDGQVVQLSLDALFGNNSTVPVSGVDLGEDDLVAAASDDRLSLPPAPPPPPLLGAAVLEQVGRDALAADDATLGDLQVTGGPQPSVSAVWTVDGTHLGTVTWSVSDSPGADTDPSCGWDRFARCTLVPVEGGTVQVGRIKARAGGGWEVAATGPSYAVQVVLTDAARKAGLLPRAATLALDERLQPPR